MGKLNATCGCAAHKRGGVRAWAQRTYKRGPARSAYSRTRHREHKPSTSQAQRKPAASFASRLPSIEAGLPARDGGGKT